VQPLARAEESNRTYGCDCKFAGQFLETVIRDRHEASQALPKWVPRPHRGQLALAERMKDAAEVLAERIAENAAKPSDKRKDPTNMVVSLTDPRAPLGRDKLKAYRPLYTVQYVVEPTSHLIMSYGCEAAVSDAGILAPMIDKTQSLIAPNGTAWTTAAVSGNGVTTDEPFFSIDTDALRRTAKVAHGRYNALAKARRPARSNGRKARNSWTPNAKR